MSTEPEPLITREKLSVEDVAKINKALEVTEGNRKAAADILGLSINRVNGAISSHPALGARWATDTGLLEGKTKINEVTIVNRVPPKPLALSQNEKTALALAGTERRIEKSLHKLGFNREEIQAISNVEEFAGKHFEETLSIMHGGLLKSAMRLMLLAERIEKTYLEDEGLEERDRKWWWDQYFRILEKLRDMNDQTNKAALTKAMIELKKKETGGLGKPGFSPTPLVNINVGTSSSKHEKKVEGWTPPPAPPEKE